VREFPLWNSRTSARMGRVAILLSGTGLLCLSAAARTEQYRTYVAPTSAETMQGPCEYELTLRDASKPVKAVFVIIERGWQVGNLYFDPEVTAFAERHDLALALARHCRAKTEEDMDIIPEHGIGRALLQSLNQFAKQSHHPELAGSKLILFSFSGGGSMVARMVAYAPDRMLAAVEYAPGHREPIGINTVTLPEAALSVPQFIIANGADDRCGTQRPYAYFEKYHDRAPMTFMVQNRVPHCCVMNVTSIVLLWLDDVVSQRLSPTDKPLRTADGTHAWEGFIKTEDSGVRSWKTEPVWNVADAWIAPRGRAAPAGVQAAGWLSSKRFAEGWLAFEKTREHPITPLE
jgi:dienelactone hydrolase